MSLEQVRVLIAEAPELSAKWPEPISLPDGLPRLMHFPQSSCRPRLVHGLTTLPSVYNARLTTLL